jgi:hypothetical protein
MSRSSTAVGRSSLPIGSIDLNDTNNELDRLIDGLYFLITSSGVFAKPDRSNQSDHGN